MTLAWPSILVPASETWAVNKGASRSGGRSLSGLEQVVAASTGTVTASLSVPCQRRDQVLAMRALLASLDGRSGSVLVGPVEVTRAPWFVEPLIGSRVSYGIGARDAAVDPAFETNPATASTFDFRVASGASLNATAFTLQRVRGGLIEPGQFFSIGGRLHMVVALIDPNPVDGAGQAAAGTFRIAIRPWLRADYSAGTPVEFGTPKGPMRLASDDTGALELQLSRFGTVALDLVEDL